MTPRAFLNISLALTGERALDEARSERLRTRLIAASDLRSVGILAEIAARLSDDPKERDAIVASEVMTSDVLRTLALRIVMLWYTGDMVPSQIGASDVPGTAPEDYFAGLLWPAISAHPPALSGGYFGHWTYPPDN